MRCWAALVLAAAARIGHAFQFVTTASVQRIRLERSYSSRVHAIEYVGIVNIGTPPEPYKVLFDTGSGAVIVPSTKCTTHGCVNKRHYDRNTSSTANAAIVAKNHSAVNQTLRFASGEVNGTYVQDRVCLGRACATFNLMAADAESDTPFGTANWDAVIGLGLPHSNVSGAHMSFIDSLVSSNRFAPQFALYFGPEVPDAAEITIGGYDPEHATEQIAWAPVTGDLGFWQITLSDLVIGGKPLNLGCGCEGCCQAVVDSGSSVMMGPKFLANLLRKELGVAENCTNAKFPTLGFQLNTSLGVKTLTLDEEDYMDRETQNATDFCWLHFMPMAAPSDAGPVLVLGMPFMRAFYSVFDVKERKIGFARAKKSKATEKQFEAAKEILAAQNVSKDAAMKLVATEKAGEEAKKAGKNQTASAETTPLIGCRLPPCGQ